jgi:hypothetical protein
MWYDDGSVSGLHYSQWSHLKSEIDFPGEIYESAGRPFESGWARPAPCEVQGFAINPSWFVAAMYPAWYMAPLY